MSFSNAYFPLYLSLVANRLYLFILKAQTLLCGVVAPCGGIDNKVPQLHPTKPQAIYSVVVITS